MPSKVVFRKEPLIFLLYVDICIDKNLISTIHKICFYLDLYTKVKTNLL